MGRDVQATRVWDRVTEAGLNATVMNVPVTFPPQRTVQRMVSGYLSPDVDKAAHPEELRKYLTESDYRLSVNAKLGHRKDKAEFIEQARQTLDARGRRSPATSRWTTGTCSSACSPPRTGSTTSCGATTRTAARIARTCSRSTPPSTNTSGTSGKRSRTTFGSSSAPRTGLRDSDTTCTATSGSNARVALVRRRRRPRIAVRHRRRRPRVLAGPRTLLPQRGGPRARRRRPRVGVRGGPRGAPGRARSVGKGRTGTPSRNGSSNARRCSAATTTLSPPTSW